MVGLQRRRTASEMRGRRAACDQFLDPRRWTMVGLQRRRLAAQARERVCQWMPPWQLSCMRLILASPIPTAREDSYQNSVPQIPHLSFDVSSPSIPRAVSTSEFDSKYTSRSCSHAAASGSHQACPESYTNKMLDTDLGHALMQPPLAHTKPILRVIPMRCQVLL